MKNFEKNLWRLLWYLPYRFLKFIRIFEKTLRFPIGWDTLYPFAPYSEGGLLRKDFLQLYNKKKITTEEYHQKEFGSYDEAKKNFQFWDRKFSNQEYLKTCWV